MIYFYLPFVELTVCHILCWWFDTFFFLKNRYYLVPASKSSIAGRKKRYINSGIRYGYLGLWQY